MIEAFDSPAVRDAERPLLAAGAPLMERAAWGLAGVVQRELRQLRGAVYGTRAALLVGPGNNGGDALVAGALLSARGVRVTAFLLAEQVHADGLESFRRAGGIVRSTGVTEVRAELDDAPTPAESSRLLADEVCATDVLVDGLLGTGGTGAVRGFAGDLVEAISARLALLDAQQRMSSGRPTVATYRRRPGRTAAQQPGRPRVIAVDVPSGIGVDDGSLPGAQDRVGNAHELGPWARVLRADRTVTFGVVKPGLLLPPAADYAGEVEVVDIGLGLPDATATRRPDAVRRLTGGDLVELGLLAAPATDSQKYLRGVLGVVAGTAQFPGAAVLAVSGAVRTGLGMVRFRGAPEVTNLVLAERPEVVPAGGRVQAWALGSGIPAAPAASDQGSREQQTWIRQALAQVTGEFASDIVGSVVPAVVDAGALALLPDRCPPWLVLTPHAGELAELLRARGANVERSDIEARPVHWAHRARELTGATILLKGAVTVVVGPSGVFAQNDGPCWLATAGAGDVLTGVLGALLATHSVEAVKDPALPALLAAAAALLHGRAARRANPGGPIAALDVATALPSTVAQLLAARS